MPSPTQRAILPTMRAPTLKEQLYGLAQDLFERPTPYRKPPRLHDIEIPKTWQDSLPYTLRTMAQEVAKTYDLPEELFLRQIQQESSFNPNAVNKRTGATGLLQLMPTTVKMFGVKNAKDPRQNLEAGGRYLRQLLDRFGGDQALALAAYNAGPTRVRRAGGIPDIEETKRYVQAILGGGRE